MPFRVAIIKDINDEMLKVKHIPAGTVMELSEYDYHNFKQLYPGCIVDIVMTEQDWIDLASKNFTDSKKKLTMLTAASESLGLGLEVDSLAAYYERSVPRDGEKVNPNIYGGGLQDVYEKSKIYKTCVDNFERQITEALTTSKEKTL